MENPHLKLNEVIYEVCQTCHNNCDYCGSKARKDAASSINEEQILKIAAAICAFPPKEIDISGGDPTLVSLKTHKKICAMFTEAGIVKKIIVNPKSKQNTHFDKILALYDVIGLSINNVQEVKAAEEIGLPEKTTIITNFNASNIWDVEAIANFVLLTLRPWQIQFTMGGLMPLYENDQALQYLNERLGSLLNLDAYKNKLIIADNANNGRCGAGLCSCGILANGDAIPCLSMVSWSKKIEAAGNLLDTPFKTIWENGFKEQRFGSFECCKDFCGRKKICPKRDSKAILPEPLNDGIWGNERPIEPSDIGPVLYGIVNPTYVYGVTKPAKSNFMAYAVSDGGTSCGDSTSFKS